MELSGLQKRGILSRMKRSNRMRRFFKILDVVVSPRFKWTSKLSDNALRIVFAHGNLFESKWLSRALFWLLRRATVSVSACDSETKIHFSCSWFYDVSWLLLSSVKTQTYRRVDAPSVLLVLWSVSQAYRMIKAFKIICNMLTIGARFNIRDRVL